MGEYKRGNATAICSRCLRDSFGICAISADSDAEMGRFCPVWASF